MIGQIIKLVQSDSWHNVSVEVEIAKGQYQKVTGWRVFIRQLKRLLKSKYYG